MKQANRPFCHLVCLAFCFAWAYLPSIREVNYVEYIILRLKVSSKTIWPCGFQISRILRICLRGCLGQQGFTAYCQSCSTSVLYKVFHRMMMMMMMMMCVCVCEGFHHSKPYLETIDLVQLLTQSDCSCNRPVGAIIDVTLTP